MRNFFLGAVSAFALAATALFAAPGPAQLAIGPLRENAAYEQLDLFLDIFERTRSLYFKDVSDAELIRQAIQGMLASLDPYSAYLPPEELREAGTVRRGLYGGVGLDVIVRDRVLRVITPIEGTPAERAGIMPGDIITHIDGEPMLGKSLPEAIEKLRGEPKSPLVLTIRRGVEMPPFDRRLTREIVKPVALRGRREGDIAYIRLASFNETTLQDLTAAVTRLKAEIGTGLKGYVLDLRDNPGGSFEAAIAVADAFLDKGEIVSSMSLRPDAKGDGKRYSATPGDIADGKPMAVLINGTSVSAAETVAGALHDNGRAVLVGNPSFGKGLIQPIFPLGEFGGLLLSTATNITPAGTVIEGSGLQPDIEVWSARDREIAARSDRNSLPAPPLDAGKPGMAADPVLETALETLRAGAKPAKK